MARRAPRSLTPAVLCPATLRWNTVAIRAPDDLDARLVTASVAAMWLFGSRARGDARADSDADLALLLGSGAPVPSLHVQGHRDATWPGLDDFVGAVDLAVARAGTIYVADLFAGTISGVRHGRSRVVAEVPSPGAVEIGPPGTLCATTGVFTEGDETGQLVQIAWRRP